MKKWILTIVGLILIASIAFAQEIVYTNQITVEWDAVMQLETGEPIPAEDVITYDVFIKNEADEETYIGNTDTLQYTLTFTEEGKYRVGIRTVRETQGEILYSEINWSDVDGASTPNPFIIAFFVSAKAPEGLRKQ